MIKLLKKSFNDDQLTNDLIYENVIQHTIDNKKNQIRSFTTKSRPSSLIVRFNLIVIDKIFDEIDDKKFIVEKQTPLTIYRNLLSIEDEYKFKDRIVKLSIKNLFRNLESQNDDDTSFTLGWHVKENEKKELLGIWLNIKTYKNNQISFQELVEFNSMSRGSYNTTRIFLDFKKSSDNNLGKIFKDFNTVNEIIWAANSFDKKHLEKFENLIKLNPLLDLKYFQIDYYAFDKESFMTLTELKGQSTLVAIEKSENKKKSDDIFSDEEKRKILRGNYSKALFNISCNVYAIRFSELIYMCIQEIEWIIRNEQYLIGETKRKLNSDEISEIMGYVESKRSESITTTARNSIYNLKKLTNYIPTYGPNEKKKYFFRNYNGEKKPSKIVLASNYWRDFGGKRGNKRGIPESRFQTICNFKDLGFHIENPKNQQKGTKLFFKFNGEQIETRSGIDKSIKVTIVSTDKVRFENQEISLTDATNKIIQRFNLVKENEKDVYHPVNCWYCYDSIVSTFVRLDKIYIEKFGFIKSERIKHVIAPRIDHQFLGEDFWNPKWKLNTLIVGTFIPKGNEEVPYFYGSKHNVLWSVISLIMFGDKESLRTYNPNFMSTLFEMKLACVDIVKSVEVEIDYVNQIIGAGFSNKKLFNKKVNIIDNMDVISDVISRNPNVNIISTWGKPFTGIKPYIKKFENILDQLKADNTWNGEYIDLAPPPPTIRSNRQDVYIDKLLVEWKKKLESKNFSI